MSYKLSFQFFKLPTLQKLSTILLYSSYNFNMASYSNSSSRLKDIRREKYVSNDSNIVKNGYKLKIMSYNILAQSLLEKHPELYANNDSMYLQWDYRKQIIFKELHESEADFFCLQEIEEDIVVELGEYLENFGYKYLYKKRTGVNVDGCAIFYLDKRFSLKNYCYVEYYRDNVRQLDRHNVGLVATFYSDISEVVIATTHILFNQKRHDVKLLQVQMLLAEIDRQAFIEENNYRPIILTGDFNFNETSPVYQFITQGFIDLRCVNNRSLVPLNMNESTNNRFKVEHMLPTYLGITDTSTYVQEIKKRYNLDKLILKNGCLIEERSGLVFKEMFESLRLSHKLNLQSICEQEDGSVASTYHDEWICVDFIFYNKNNFKKQKKLKLVSFSRLPTPDQCQDTVVSMPNQYCPSDHFPLTATFVLI